MTENHYNSIYCLEHEPKFPRSCSLERTRTPSIRSYPEKLEIPARARSKDEPKSLIKDQENILPREEKEENEVKNTLQQLLKKILNYFFSITKLNFF